MTSPRTVVAVACAVAAVSCQSARAEIIVGLGEGAAPVVSVWDPFATSAPLASFFAYSAGFTGGVRVATGDLNGDGKADIVTGAGPGGAPHVRVFSGLGAGPVISDFFAYTPSYSGGVNVAMGDVNNDGRADIITGAGPGAGPHVKVFSGATGGELRSFFAYDPAFQGGVRVASGDVSGDGFSDIVTGAGPGAGPHIKVFSGASGAEQQSFFAFSPTFQGGVFVASGDIDGDGLPDIVAGAGEGGAPQVNVFSGATGELLSSFLAFGPSFTGGVRVATADLNGDGHADIVTGAGPGALPEVRVYSGADGALLSSFLAGDRGFTGGVYVAAIPAPGALALLAPAGLLAMRRRR